MALIGKIQELQNEIICMDDSRDFQDAESERSGHSHVACQLVSFPPHPIPEGMLMHSFVTPSRREGPPSIGDTHGTSGNVFAIPVVSSTAPYPQELNPWSSRKKSRFTHQQRRRTRINHQFRIRDASLDRQPKIQSSSVDETLQRIMGQTNNDCRFQIFTLTSSLHQRPLLAGR